ncbi:formate dehydrogenase accessory sulfurtransferase FdhD [Rhodanobacter sp. DHB23]|uniref:formate dehydrogenase accessory sulfurtransferase FdhD n=1 Tax=Rhodanobacter sp. DHB23 TaxID=2775923 RepID=UPI00177CB15F|nr:formate dehydrogenase accessory sulfurtransferase FdhD [Rhodanobacter sp. DHB23]MBD8873638.1 formate dehydrogenase accessory sulfurtransferase FdhD [Rhodanobacter sp. DHB23]
MLPTDSSAPPAVPASPGYVGRRIERWRHGHGEPVEDCIAEEMPIAMLYNGVSFAVMMATPHDLEDFALGFSLSEGLVTESPQLRSIARTELLEGIQLAITVAPEAPAARLDEASRRLLPGRGSCGICGTRELEDAVRQPGHIRNPGSFRASALERALAQLPARQPMNAATGAVHAAAWADAEGNVVLVREDVGRHNALDKLIGAMARAGITPDSGMLLLTSRASYEMVTKAANAGIGFMAAISAPTALAIELARSAGVCLVGFARPGNHNVYTCPDRLVAD